MVGGASDLIGLHARLQPERLAALDLTSGRRWTYRALDQAIGQCASVLRKRGLKPGDRVAGLAKNSDLLPILHHACARIGALYVPFNWRLAEREILDLIEDAGPTAIFTDNCLSVAGMVAISLDQLADEISGADVLEDILIDPHQPSLILYTSGTSGRPKGAVLTEHNLRESAINFSLLGSVTRDSVFLCDAPMFHVIGLVVNIRTPLMRGGTIVISDGFVPSQTLDRLGDPELRVTHYFCVPQMAAALRTQPQFDPSRLKGLTGVFTGGAPHPAESIRSWLADGIPIADGFGMSEAGTVFGMPADIGLIERRAGSAGIAAPGVRTRIVDDEDRDCPTGCPGNLLLKGDNVTKGYWRRPEETAKAFTADGWFRTGDIAVSDSEGFHWLVDRRKDMFISGGENVYPAEIEAVVTGQPGIAECAVVGVADPRWGEVGHLVLVPLPGAKVDGESVLASIEARLARYKIPKHVTIANALPRNGVGKILKSELKRLLDDDGSV